MQKTAQIAALTVQPVSGEGEEEQCECMSNWTGPTCLVPYVGEFAICDLTG